MVCVVDCLRGSGAKWWGFEAGGSFASRLKIIFNANFTPHKQSRL